MNTRFNLSTKMLWIPVSILVVTFISMGTIFSSLMVTNSNETLRKDMANMIETERNQLVTGLSIISSTQLAGDAMLGLEGNDPEIANDLIKQVKTMGLNAVYFTDLYGNVIHPKGAPIPEELKQKLKAAEHTAGHVETTVVDTGMCGYTTIMDVETPTGFLVFHIDIPENIKGYAVNNMENTGEVQSDLVSERLAIFHDEVAKDHESFLNRMLFTIFMILGPALLIIVFVLGTSSKKIVNRIDRLLNAFKKQAEGDLAQEVVVKSHDEISDLTSAFNQTNQKLSHMMHEIASHSETISVSSAQLSGSSETIAADAEEQYSKTLLAAGTMQELGVSFIEVAQNTGTASKSVMEANEIAVSGGEVVEKTIEGMNKISKSVKDSAVTIEALGMRSQQVGDIVEVINDIAGQTNLLALNAAIEAARAGEQGRGFAVVADEVRKLAERTTAATGEIADMIKGIQVDTEKAVESMHIGTSEVEEGVGLANQAGESLQQILDSVKNVSDIILEINSAVERQSVASDEITLNIDNVATITKQNIESTKESLGAIVHMDDMASKLKMLVGGFKLKNNENNGKVDSRSPGPNKLDNSNPTAL